VNNKVRRAVNQVVNKSNLKIFQNLDTFDKIKSDILKKKNDLELDPSVVESIRQNEKRIKGLRKRRVRNRRRPDRPPGKRPNSKVLKRVSNDDIELN
jgi:hypothetical protein